MVASIISRLRAGVPQEELRNPFAAESMAAYCATIGLVFAVSITLPLLDMSIEAAVFMNLLYPAWWWVGGVLAKRVGHHRIGTFAEAIGIIGCASFAFVLLQVGLTAIAWPDADAWLISVDRVLGFSWKHLANSLHPHQQAMIYITVIYRSILWQPPIIIAFLCYFNRTDRVWTLVLAWLIGLTIVMAVYPFVPAQGGFIYYHYQPSDWPGRLSEDPWNFGPIISALRDGGVREIRPGDMTGLVSFPSFHVAAAVLLAWAAWPLRVIGPMALALNIGMSLAAIICGPHYLIDVLGGVAVGLIAIAVAYLISRRSSDDDDCHEASCQ